MKTAFERGKTKTLTRNRGRFAFLGAFFDKIHVPQDVGQRHVLAVSFSSVYTGRNEGIRRAVGLLDEREGRQRRKPPLSRYGIAELSFGLVGSGLPTAIIAQQCDRKRRLS